MLYYFLKMLHIVSATGLLMSMSYSFYLWWHLRVQAEVSKENQTIQNQTLLIIIPLAIFQLISGFTMISLSQENLSQLWIKGSVIGFIGVIITWLGFIYFSASNRRLLQAHCLVGCGLSLFAMIFLMANKI